MVVWMEGKGKRWETGRGRMSKFGDWCKYAEWERVRMNVWHFKPSDHKDGGIR